MILHSKGFVVIQLYGLLNLGFPALASAKHHEGKKFQIARWKRSPLFFSIPTIEANIDVGPLSVGIGSRQGILKFLPTLSLSGGRNPGFGVGLEGGRSDGMDPLSPKPVEKSPTLNMSPPPRLPLKNLYIPKGPVPGVPLKTKFPLNELNLQEGSYTGVDFPHSYLYVPQKGGNLINNDGQIIMAGPGRGMVPSGRQGMITDGNSDSPMGVAYGSGVMMGSDKDKLLYADRDLSSVRGKEGIPGGSKYTIPVKYVSKVFNGDYGITPNDARMRPVKGPSRGYNSFEQYKDAVKPPNRNEDEVSITGIDKSSDPKHYFDVNRIFDGNNSSNLVNLKRLLMDPQLPYILESDLKHGNNLTILDLKAMLLEALKQKEVQENKKLNNVLVNIVEKLKTTEYGSFSSNTLPNEVQTENIDMTAVFQAFDFEKVKAYKSTNEAMQQLFDFLTNVFEISKHTTNNEFLNENTKGTFLKSFLKELLKNDNVPSNIKRDINLLIPFINLDGHGAELVKHIYE